MVSPKSTLNLTIIGFLKNIWIIATFFKASFKIFSYLYFWILIKFSTIAISDFLRKVLKFSLLRVESYSLLEKTVAWLFINRYLICNRTDIISKCKFIEYYFLIPLSSENNLIYLWSLELGKQNKNNTF